MHYKSTRMAFICAAALSQIAFSQTAAVQGYLGNFEIVNLSGKVAHGFEIQIEGAKPTDLYYTYSGGRYSLPTVVPYATGVYVRFASSYDAVAHQYSASTPVAPGNPSFSWQDCYQGGVGYATSGCEVFGQSLFSAPPNLAISGRWLVDDPANPGTLVALNPPAAIPATYYAVATGGVLFSPPVVVAQVEAPEPPETPEKFGDAQWIKVFKTQLNRPVSGNELVSSNTSVVPSDPAQLEVAWDIVQVSPPGNGNQTRTRRRVQGNIAADTRAVIRRVETYKYTGAYDSVTHKVTCADGTCTAPSAGELGAALAATNSALNVTADSLTVSKTGNGTVSGAGGKIACGNACALFAPNGTAFSLTATPSGTVFNGWSGACSGNSTACSLVVSGQTVAAADFQPQFTLSIGRSNSGTVLATPAGNDRALNCGSACSAKFTNATTVTLTAVPPSGKTFVSWSGGCSGTSPSCSLTITQNTSVQAVFSK